MWSLYFILGLIYNILLQLFFQTGFKIFGGKIYYTIILSIGIETF